MTRTRIRPLWLLAFVGGCDAAPAPARPSEIAFEWVGPSRAAITVPVHVNGDGPYRFVVDTGATLTCIEQEVAETLELEESSRRVGYAASLGGAGRVRLVRIDSLRVGPARAEGITACALDLTAAEQVGVELDGLIGLDFLQMYRVVLDFERDVLQLHLR